MTEETIFEGALGRSDPAERSAYLDQACGRDRALRRRVEALLESHDNGGAFLERPAVEQITITPSQAEETVLGFLQPPTKPGSLGRLAHYEVLEVLGQGGCGIVLKAFDEKLQRLVAIKVMAPHLAATSPPRKRFLREARAAAAIRHENVVHVYQVEDQPIPYLVMEYVAGETLQQKLDRTGPLDVSEVLRLGQQVAAGLAAAHALGLIHRDIKPANILLEDGVELRVKITDLGLARAADDASLTKSGDISGTPMYMSPEQAQGAVLDSRADLFSLGSVLYVACSGRPPFRAPNTLAVLKRVVEDEPRPIRAIIPEVPNWLCAIIAKLHAKKPEERFDSAKAVADLLARHLAKLQQDRGLPPPPDVSQTSPKPAPAVRTPAQAASPPRKTTRAPAPTPRPPVRRKWGWAVAAAAAFFLLLVGMSLSEATGVTNVGGTVIRLFSPEGTLVVEVDDPAVSVTVDGADVVITGAGAKEIRLKPGQYKVEASKDGQVLSQELVTVSKNGRQVVRVSKEAGPVAAAGQGGKPGTTPNPPPKRSLDLKYIPADASAAVVFHPRRLVQSPLIAGALPPGAADEMARELGVKPEQVDQVIVLVQLDADLTPVPGAIIRFAEPADGKKVLTGLLKGLREEKHEGKSYYRSSTGEAFLGVPLAGAVTDERTVLVAPEPILRKMLVADGGARSPLLDRLRETDNTDEVTGVVIVEPYRHLLKAMTEPLKAQLPADLANAGSLPDRLVAVAAAVNLNDKTLLKLALESDSEESVEVLDRLAFKGLNWARKVYPDVRPSLIKGLPTEVVQPALAVVDQVFGGIQITREGKRLVVRLEKPESLDTSAEKLLIASSGFNDAKGMNSNPVPGSPFVLDTPNKEGGVGEPGWAGPWLAHQKATFQSKVVFEGDGALYLEGSPNVGPNYGRQLAKAQTGRFQLEYHVQVPAGSSCAGYVWQDPNGGAFHSGPNWAGGGGKFTVHSQDTGIKCEPGKWYKVTLRIDVPTQTWEFFVDGKRFDSPQPLKFRTKVEYLDFINFLVEGGVYIDDLRVTRLPDVGGKD